MNKNILWFTLRGIDILLVDGCDKNAVFVIKDKGNGCKTKVLFDPGRTALLFLKSSACWKRALPSMMKQAKDSAAYTAFLLDDNRIEGGVVLTKEEIKEDRQKVQADLIGSGKILKAIENLKNGNWKTKEVTC